MSDPIGPLEDALRHTPQNVPLRLYVAGLLAEKGYWQRAMDHYREVLEIEPASVEASLGLGKAHLTQGDAASAVPVLNRALGMDPDTKQAAQVRVALSRALLELGELENAREHYRNAVRGDSSAANRELAARLFEDTGEGGSPGDPIRLLSSDGPTLAPDVDERPAMGFKDVGGMTALKETLRMSIIYPFQHPEVYAAYGRKIGGGILLYGPPGCGKTYIARATAGEIHARFLAVGLSDILDMWYGESERKLHELFETARSQAPSVLFFDEVEAMGHSRTRMSQFTAGRTLVNQFLAEMDGINSRNESLLIIGATNSPWDLDPAFRRPGRFDRVIFVAPPDHAARVEILKLHCRDKPLASIDFDALAARMDRYSGADIKAVCEQAAEKALEEALRSGTIRKISMADFYEALKKVKPTTTEWLQTAQNYARYSNKSGLYTEVQEYLDQGKR